MLRADERSRVLPDGSEFDWGIEDIPWILILDVCGYDVWFRGIAVMDNTVDMVEAMANINAFYAHELVDNARRRKAALMKKLPLVCVREMQEKKIPLLSVNQLRKDHLCL